MTPSATIEAQPAQSQAKLPELRGELRLVESAPDAGGAPTWTIHDPVRHRYFQIGREAFHILSAWSLGAPAIVAARASAQSGLELDAEDVVEVARFCRLNRLTESSDDATQKGLLDHVKASEQTWTGWLVHNYLFMRIPIVHPQAFLARTLPLVQPLFGTAGLSVIAAITLAGLYFVSRQWDTFTSTFLHFFSLKGLALYGVTLVLVKIAHELGHAYMATRFGVRVGAMGIAFLVMAPVLYTDVTEAWQLKSRRQRVLINSAGVMVELMIAGLATFLWAFLPEGPLKSAAFFLATTSWLTTLAVNLNPLVRFDGYYLLSDALGLPNLQSRAFALGRWWLRETLFALRQPAPEELRPRTAAFMITYAFVVWITRLVMFIGIALLVYHTFFKLLGILLFAIEIGWFIAKPVWSELKAWWHHKDRIMTSRRAAFTGAVLAGLVVWAALPVHGGVSVPAVLRAADEARVFAPRPAQVAAVHAREGQAVAAGDVLVELAAPDLDFESRQTEQRIVALRGRLDRRGGDKMDRAESLVLEQQMGKELARSAGLATEKAQLVVRAPVAGLVKDIDPGLHAGRWISHKTQLVLVRSKGAAVLQGYAEESDVGRIARGAKGVFIPDDPTQPKARVEVTAVAQSGAETIDIAALASIYEGAIAVEPDAGRKLRPRQAQFQVTMATGDAPPPMALRGTVMVEGRSVSSAGRAFQQMLQIVVREAGL